MDHAEQIEGLDAAEPATVKTVDSYHQDKDRSRARLGRVEGQVRGLRRMVEEDRCCGDVLTQISSLIAAARSIGLVLLEDHIRGCVMNADDKEASIQELTDAIARFTKSVG